MENVRFIGDSQRREFFGAFSENGRSFGRISDIWRRESFCKKHGFKESKHRFD